MSKFEHSAVAGNSIKEGNRDVWARINEVYDEEDRIIEEAAELFGVTEDYVRCGRRGFGPDPEIVSWMDEQYKLSGWEYKY